VFTYRMFQKIDFKQVRTLARDALKSEWRQASVRRDKKRTIRNRKFRI
jgi:hypothetical protein